MRFARSTPIIISSLASFDNKTGSCHTNAPQKGGWTATTPSIHSEELDRSKLPDYLKFNYGNPADGVADLGGSELVVGAFVGFQKHLYF